MASSPAPSLASSPPVDDLKASPAHQLLELQQPGQLLGLSTWALALTTLSRCSRRSGILLA